MTAIDDAGLSREREDRGDRASGPLPAGTRELAWSTHRARIGAVSVLVVFGAALGIAASPGRMSADTLSQISEVSTGEYTDWHAGLLLVLWRPFWLIGAGPGFVTVAAIITFVLGLYGVLRVGLSRPAGVIGTIVITLLPPVLGWVIYLGRDMWFTTFLLVACAALVRTVDDAGGARRVACIGLVVAVWLMLAARQNALPACAVLIFAMFWMISAHRHHQPGKHRTASRLLWSGLLALLVLIAVGGSQVMMRRAFDVRATHIEQAVYIYDIAAISIEEGEVLFNPQAFPAQDLALLDALFDSSTFEPMVFGSSPIIPYPMSGRAFDELRDDWLDAVVSHPLTYLEERATAWLEQISVTEPSVWVVHPHVDPNQWGYTARFPAIDDAIQHYLRFFAANDQLVGGLVHVVWPYLLVLVAGLWYLRSDSARRRTVGWMCLAGLAYQASLFFATMVANYRFSVPCVVLALAVVAITIPETVKAMTHRPHAGSPAPS